MDGSAVAQCCRVSPGLCPVVLYSGYPEVIFRVLIACEGELLAREIGCKAKVKQYLLN